MDVNVTCASTKNERSSMKGDIFLANLSGFEYDRKSFYSDGFDTPLPQLYDSVTLNTLGHDKLVWGFEDVTIWRSRRETIFF